MWLFPHFAHQREGCEKGRTGSIEPKCGPGAMGKSSDVQGCDGALLCTSKCSPRDTNWAIYRRCATLCATQFGPPPRCVTWPMALRIVFPGGTHIRRAVSR